MGIACADEATTREALVAYADEAMYRSKRAGQGAPVLHGAD
jgi:GGDEF domain-containing protein